MGLWNYEFCTFLMCFLERYETQTIDQSCWNPVASRVNKKTCPGVHNDLQAKPALESLSAFSINFIINFSLYIRDTSSHSISSLISR